MRIPRFVKLVEQETTEYQLKDCAVVIDGHNFFYNKYRDSGLPYIFGCDSDKYAQYLRDYMDNFKKANVKCFIVFKGGNQEKNNFQNKRPEEVLKEKNEIVLPIFMKVVYKQVLEEMDIDYVISEFEAKEDIIALAHEKKCPIISFDIEFCFSGELYIPYSSIKFDGDTIRCGLFQYTEFVNKMKLDNEKMSIFITLTDINIFNDLRFDTFFNSKRMLNKNKCILLLKWLALNSIKYIYSDIHRYLKAEQTDQFSIERQKVQNYICKRNVGGIALKYFRHDNEFSFTEYDSQWFAKGVALGYIAIPFINFYHTNIIYGTWVLESKTSEDSVLLSMDIITYAYNLLTNFERNEFTFIDKNNVETTINTRTGVNKPNYEAKCSPFENGWDNIRDKNFFQHFLKNTITGFPFGVLQKLTADEKLLVIALIYFSYKKRVDVKNIVCSALLSYILLEVLSIEDINDMTHNEGKGLLTKFDCIGARYKLADVLQVTEFDKYFTYNENLLHPLVEFQYCLFYMNFLNSLCAYPYKPTIYHRTYNGSLVYKILYTIENEYGGNADKFIDERLSSTESVLTTYYNIYDVYHEIKRYLD